MSDTTCYPSDTDWGQFDWDAATDQQKRFRDLAEEFAWDQLDRLTAGDMSACPISVRPAKFACRRSAYYLASTSAPAGPFNPYIGLDGLWRNDAHGWDCECDDARVITLPTQVGDIQSITIGATVLPPTAYRVDNGVRLVRQDGAGWPLRQNMYALPGADDTFVVTYYPGTMPGRLEKYAAGVLAMEFLKSVAGDKACRLPKGTTNVTRNGTSVTIDPGLFDNKITGIPEVDAIVKRHNPYALASRSRVYSPDTINRMPITTWRSGVPVGSQPGQPPQGGTLIPDPQNPGYYMLAGD